MMHPLILIVDDDEDDRLLLRLAIENIIDKAFIFEAENATAAFKWLRQGSQPTPFDLVLLDMNMPGTNGLEMIAGIRSDPGMQYIPIVMISTDAAPPFVKQAYTLGANAFIQKPFTTSGYQALVQSLGTCFLAAP